MRAADAAGATERPGALSVGVLRWEDQAGAAAVLARAFVVDPLVIAICNAPTAERQERMRWSFRMALRSHHLARQPAWTIGGTGGVPWGVVLVTRSRLLVPAHSDLVFTLRGLWHVGLRAAVRGLRAAQVIAAHAPLEPFTYLRTLGVDPDRQRCGVGSRLVEQVLRAAPQVLPVYLETAKEQNLSFYARHGFAGAGEFRCLGVPVWRLLRPPVADSTGFPR
jgi:GNAT superfamily N-acetyltransferase